MHFSEVKREPNIRNLKQPVTATHLQTIEERPSLSADYIHTLERAFDAPVDHENKDSSEGAVKKPGSFIGRFYSWLTSMRYPLMAPKRDIDIHEWRRLEYRNHIPRGDSAWSEGRSKPIEHEMNFERIRDESQCNRLRWRI